jgi:hypothetical protein
VTTDPEAGAVSTAPATVRNPISLLGVALTTASALIFLAYVVAEAFGLVASPYGGLFGFVLVPALFVLGLVLIPFGIWRENRRRRQGKAPWSWPVLDFASRTTRRVTLAIALLTLVNILIIFVAGLGAVHYMETTQFCGQVCHVPMKPQMVAHQAGAHAQVPCVDCHVSPGVRGMVRAKLNGTRQLYQVAVGNFPRPIHAEGRVPGAADTCVHCHRAGFANRDLTRSFRDYAEDETNTETVATFDMLMSRIHWHARADVVVEYAVSATDPNVVPYVRTSQGGGAPTEYFAPDVTAAPAGPLKRMDCLDCHSRPAHTFGATAERVVDRAIAAGEIDRALPFVRREVVAAVKAEYPTEEAALAAIGKRLNEFYAAKGKAPEVAAAIATAQRLYRTNVFPEMKVTWGTYVPQIGHVDTAGCFRCHDDEKKTRDGKLVRQDCDLCHRER